MQYPSDYFQACCSTSLCRSKCVGVWDAFDAILAASTATSSTQQVQVAVESLFFPTLTVDSFTPMRIRATVQLASCTQICEDTQQVGDT